MKRHENPRRIFSPLLIAGLFPIALLVGCDKKKEAPKPEAPVEVQTEHAKASPKKNKPTKLAALAPDVPKTKISGIPTPEELEEEAATTLSPENLEAELDRLEAEITGE